MPEEPTPPNPLDGIWEGYYDHDNKAYSPEDFPINATIAQRGHSIQGTMIDGITEIRYTPRMIIEVHDGRISPGVMRRVRRFLAKNPDFEIESALPAKSQLEGEIIDDRVYFLKTYLGPCSDYGNAGDKRRLLRRIKRHQVVYEGTLNEDRGIIEGRWAIRCRFLGRFRRPLATGGFQLLKTT